MLRRRYPAFFCVISVVLVFSLSCCGGGVTDAALVYSTLKDTSITPSPSIVSSPGAILPPATTPGAAASAVQVLKQNGITVLNYWCVPVSFSNGDLSPGATVSQFMISQILVVASIPVKDVAMISHNQNPDPLSAFAVYDPTTSSMGNIGLGNNSFDCTSNGW